MPGFLPRRDADFAARTAALARLFGDDATALGLAAAAVAD